MAQVLLESSSRVSRVEAYTQLHKYPEHVIREAAVITGIPCIIVPLAMFDEHASEDTNFAMVKNCTHLILYP